MQPALIRMKHDLKEIRADDCDEFIVDIQLKVGRPLTVEAWAIGPISSLYGNDTFKVTMQILHDYPFAPPTMAIKADINHDVAQLMEELMQDFFEHHWVPTNTIKVILDRMLACLHMI